MSLLFQIAERALNRPLLVHPDKLPLILGVLEGRIPLGDISALRDAARSNIEQLPGDAQATMLGPNPTASRFVGSSTDQDPVSGRSTTLPYRRTQEGIAIIPVIGSLVNRGAWLGSNSGETSYEGIKFQIAHASNDPKTKAILLDIDSPGGEAVGCFECAAAVRAAAAIKPVSAVVNGMAASAAYAIAAAANRVVTTPSGVVGSIGVVLLHGDFSRKLDKEGVTPTLIFAGAHKVDGHPFAPLSKAVAADLQAEVDSYYQLFVSGIATGRRMSESAVRSTEARTYIGAAAVTAGLADEVGTFESAMAGFVPKLSANPSPSHSHITAAASKPAPAADVALSPDELAAIINGTASSAQLEMARPRSNASPLVVSGDALTPDELADRINGANPRLPKSSSSQSSARADSAMSAEEVAASVNGQIESNGAAPGNLDADGVEAAETRAARAQAEVAFLAHGWDAIVAKINGAKR